MRIQHQVYNENLKRLRAELRREAKTQLEASGDIAMEEVSGAVLDKDRETVTLGLAAVAAEELEYANDDAILERYLSSKPELEEAIRELKLDEMSEVLGIPLWYLLAQNQERLEQCIKACLLIRTIRGEALSAQVNAFEQEFDRLKPVFEQHPGITAGEAEKLLQQETEKTVRSLEDNNDAQ